MQGLNLETMKVDVADVQHWPQARKCGNCRACCIQLAVEEKINKPCNTPCKYLTRKGCGVYHNAELKPGVCGAWSCRWRLGDTPTDNRRPDRSHVIYDVKAESLIWQENKIIQAEVIWCDPNYRDAWEAPEVIAYMLLIGQFDIATVVRYEVGADYFAMFPPTMPSNDSGQWIRSEGIVVSREEHEADLARLSGKNATPLVKSTIVEQNTDDAGHVKLVVSNQTL